MNTRETIDHLYQRVGRHLSPKIDAGVAYLSKKPLPIREDVCQRTGLTGPVVVYEESQHGIVKILTMANLLWMFGTHPMPIKNGEIAPVRLGSQSHLLILTPDAVLTNIQFQSPIPGLVAMDAPALMRATAQQSEYLFISFPKSATRILGNGLRWSFGDNLEINGDYKAGKNVLSNIGVNLQRPRQLAEIDEIDSKDMWNIHRLIRKDDRTENDQAKLKTLLEKRNIGLASPTCRLLRHATSQDLAIAKVLQLSVDEEQE
jgi:hypothetical protein